MIVVWKVLNLSKLHKIDNIYNYTYIFNNYRIQTYSKPYILIIHNPNKLIKLYLPSICIKL